MSAPLFAAKPSSLEVGEHRCRSTADDDGVSRMGRLRTYSTLDAGLVRIEESATGLPRLRYRRNRLSVRRDRADRWPGSDWFADARVRRHQRVAEGEIRALFFRYQSLGGFDYASDVLIGPRADEKSAGAPPLTRPGDSGSLWFYDPPRTSAEPEDPDDLGERELPAERREHARPVACDRLRCNGVDIVC